MPAKSSTFLAMPFIISAAVLLNGCASQLLDAHVTTYHAPAIKLVGQSYHLITPPEIAMAANTPTGFVY
ncbi:MAG: hypothetical protein GY821_01405 [Gammaproteobacteria bacterium]|nr:hypothetical protein [Gammaproteobacteria bacterium]